MINTTKTTRASFLKNSRDVAALASAGLSGQVLASEQIPHKIGKAKHVIWLFMEGGPSHLDLFDRKPLLNKLAGKPLPPSFGKPVTAAGEADAPILGSKREWGQYGESGLWLSDWLPHHRKIADDLCVIRSCMSDGINHAGGVCQMNTGAVFAGRPSLGAWMTYGFGTENQNLPAFVVMKDSNSRIVNGVRAWGSGFMPSRYQGVLLNSEGDPINHLSNPEGVTKQNQSNKLNYINSLNRNHFRTRSFNTDLEARIKSYEMTSKLQKEAPDAIDIKNEPKHIQELYGMDKKETSVFGRQCLLARRLVERGVRFVQLYHGAGSKWDSHSNIESNHSKLCKSSDQPIVALITDLKQRGLLDETLIVWGGEFGRTPMSEKGSGRDHNPMGFTMWFAGGGVKGGQTVGETDELGLHAVKDKLHVHDIHSTIMAMTGMDHTKVIFNHKGRPERVDVNEGHVSQKIVNSV